MLPAFKFIGAVSNRFNIFDCPNIAFTDQFFSVHTFACNHYNVGPSIFNFFLNHILNCSDLKFCPMLKKLHGGR